MPKYKNINTLKAGNPALFQTIEYISNMYEYHRNNEVKTGYYTVNAVHFAIGGVEYKLAIKIENGEVLHSFEKRTKRARSYAPIGIRTVRALIRRAT